MGFRDWLVHKAAQSFGEREGKQLPTKAINFLQRNKKWFSGPFLAVTTWAFVKECPPLVIFDIPFSPADYLSCNQIDIIVSLIGGILLGAGVINSDQFHRAQQGKSNVEVTLVDKNTGEEVKKL